MRKLLLLGTLIVGIQISTAWADASADLQSRLSKVNSFQANFTQKVVDADGALVQEGEGQLWVKRPNLFHWHMTSPDESTLISDGKDVWFYNPFVEQVTVTHLSDSTSDTPFILITRNNVKDWKQYTVAQNGNQFNLTPKSQRGTLKGFSITVLVDGTIEKFSAVEQDGQTSAYQLKGQQNHQVDSGKFKFTPPAGVTLDDQRSRRKG